MRRLINPYVAGSALRRGRGFFGRQDTLQRVVRELHNPHINTLLFFGQRGIGKTSFLYQLRQILLDDAFLVVYVDLQQLVGLSVGQVLEELAYLVGEVAHLDSPKPDVFDDQGRFFRRSFLPQLKKKLGAEQRLVFLLDEVDALEPATARSLMTASNWAAFVFMMGKGEEELSPDLRVIFKDADMREVLWLLSPESAERLIRQAESHAVLRFTDQAVARILSLTSGHPYLTQLLCRSIWERANDGQKASTASLPTQNSLPLIERFDVEGLVPEALAKGKEKLGWWWNGLSRNEKIYAAAVAQIATENEWIAKERVIQLLSNVTLEMQNMELAMRALVKRRVLEEIEDRKYRFSIELFRRWVHTERPLQHELAQIPSSAEEPRRADYHIRSDIAWPAPSNKEELQLFRKRVPETYYVAYLDLIVKRAASVCRIEIPEGNALGTGFLIAPNLLLTNYHVLSDKKGDIKQNASQAVLRFGYMNDAGQNQTFRVASPTPILAFSVTQELDYVLLQVEDKIKQATGIQPAPVEHSQIPTKGTGLGILHHPLGDAMKFEPSINNVEDVDSKHGLIRYRSKTLEGSSGSPCFNEEGKVVAMHRSKDAWRWGQTIQTGILFSSIYREIKHIMMEGDTR